MTRKLTGNRNFRFAKQIHNGFGAFESVTDLEEFTTAKVYADASNFADNVQNIKMKALKSIDIDASFSEVSAKTKAVLQGKKYEAGGVLTTAEDKSSPVCIAYERNYSDGTAERVIYYNVTLYEKDVATTSETDSIEFTSQGFTGTAIPYTNAEFDLKNAIEYIVDNGDPNFDEDKFNSFFDFVQIPGTNKYVELEHTGTAVTDISVKGITFESNKFKIPATFKGDFTFKSAGSEKKATYSEATNTWTVA